MLEDLEQADEVEGVVGVGQPLGPAGADRQVEAVARAAGAGDAAVADAQVQADGARVAGAQSHQQPAPAAAEIQNPRPP